MPPFPIPPDCIVVGSPLSAWGYNSQVIILVLVNLISSNLKRDIFANIFYIFTCNGLTRKQYIKWSYIKMKEIERDVLNIQDQIRSNFHNSIQLNILVLQMLIIAVKRSPKLINSYFFLEMIWYNINYHWLHYVIKTQVLYS